MLKQYLIEGYALNEKRLSALNRTVEVQRALLTHYAKGTGADSDEVIAVLDRFTTALSMLDDYDHQCLSKPKKSDKKVVYLDERECFELIRKTSFNQRGDLFGVNVDTIGLHLRNIYREEELETSTYEESSVVRFESNVRKTHFANADRPTALYGLDMILAVGTAIGKPMAARRRANGIPGAGAMTAAACSTSPIRTSMKPVPMGMSTSIGAANASAAALH